MIDHRTGRFTSSGIFALIKSGRGADFSAPGLTYISEKRIERLLQRSLGAGQINSVAIKWGNMMEKILWEFHLEQDGYELVSQNSLFHPDPVLAEVWSGMPDLVNKEQDEIGEVKCYQLKKFAEYAICLMQKDIDLFRENFPQEYWQIVSNSILTGHKYGSAIAFMPYRRELELIINEIENTDILEKYGFKPWEYRFLVEDNIDDLPYIEIGGHFKNIVSFRFEVPESDKNLLTERVLLAKKILES